MKVTITPDPTRPKGMRGYSRAFTPADGRGKRYMLDKVPAALLQAAKRKCKRERISLRAVLLSSLQAWVNEGDLP
jgi:hypothetical protein